MSVTLLQIEPTSRCNYTCGFCCGRFMPQEDQSYETFVAALDSLPDLQHIEVQGEGEPLLHPRFFDMLDLAGWRGIGTSFITNGSLLDPEAVSRILDAGVSKISVSIESANPEVFKAIRGGRLDKVIRNLEHLIDERSRRNLSRPVVGFSITVLRSTRDHLSDILTLYRKLRLDGGVTLNPLQTMEAYLRHYDAQLQGEVLPEAEAEDVWLRFISDAEVRRIQRSRAATRGFYDELMDGWRPATKSCPWLDKGIYVHRRGDVTACCVVKDTARHSLGRIGVDDLSGILARRKEMRDQLHRGEVPVPCSGCKVARFALMSKSRLVRFGVRGAFNRWFGSHDDAGDKHTEPVDGVR